MMMDDIEDVEETIERLQKEWRLECSNGDNSNTKKPYTPSYCYGCARTAGVAVYRKPLAKTKEKKKGGSSAKIGRTASGQRKKQPKSRTIPQVKNTANLQVLARIKKKALNTLLAQKGTSAANGHSSQGNGTKKPSVPSKSKGVFPCNKCGLVFSYIYTLKRHQKRRCCIKFTREYPCTECGETFLAKKPFLRHVRTHNFTNSSTAAKYLCGECGETFSGQRPYFQHMRSHKPVARVVPKDPNRPFACNKCNRSFSRVVYLSQHKKVHEKALSFSCQYCAKMFKTKYHLTRHEATHMNIKPYPCQICGMAFTRDSYRKTHERIHNKTTQS